LPTEKDEPTKKDKLLADKNVTRWYNNLKRGSEHTAEIALRRLSLYCELNKVTPKGLVEGAPKARLAKRNFDLLCDTVTNLQERGNKGSYIDGIRKAVVSWLRFNEIVLKDRVKVEGARDSNVFTKTPEPLEVMQIYAAAPLRTKVAIALMAYSGLRPESLGDMHGTDGLRLGDFPQLVLEPEPHFESNPTQVIVRSSLSKAGHQYFSLLNGKGTDSIVAYLKERKGKGETLSKETPLMQVFGMKQTEGEFVGTANISWQIKRAITRAGFDYRPYDLRSFFDSQLLIAENRGKIARDFRVFFMGHRGTIEGVYTTHRRTLNESMLVEMKNAYTEASKFLTESGSTARSSEILKEMELFKYEMQVQAYHEVGRATRDAHQLVADKERELGRRISAEERMEVLKSFLDKLDVKEATQLFEGDDGSDNRVLQAKLAERRKPFNDGKERVVTEEELPEWLDRGYITKQVLQSGKVVVQPA